MNVAPEKPRKPRIQLSATAEDTIALPLLNEEVLLQIRKSLGQGMSGFARQGDIAELHKRIGEKFAVLPDEIGKQIADAFRQSHDATAALKAEVASVVKDLNSLEGAVRIELAPMIEEVVRNSIASAEASRSRLPLVLGVVLSLLVGTVAGAFWHSELTTGFQHALSSAQQLAERISG